MTTLAALVATSAQVSATSARLGKIAALARFLAAVSAEELELAVHYLAGELPQGRIGVGYASLERATSAVTGPGGSLTLADVDRAVSALAALTGTGAAARRAQALAQLFARAGAAEQQFLVRLLIGELRQGALGGLMVDAIAAAAQLPPSEVRRAAMYCASLGAVARAALSGGSAALRQFQLELFAPVYPMLAQTADDVGEALRVLSGELAFEWKLDGARIQVHRQEGQVRVYTRSLNEVTDALPEVVELVRELPAAELVLDGEAIALNASGRPHPFQVTMRRFGRRLDVAELRATLPIRAFFFDCLRVGPQSLTDRPARERFAALDALVPQQHRVPRLITA
ncbi:MAG TPA: ATP-dependent DNA ligase, partial [Candidatus Dormibacteraeota bacterium]|nr:ATP-dependent DNA ligase [Candidatus Dormibacteraeota bacterium]